MTSKGPHEGGSAPKPPAGGRLAVLVDGAQLEEEAGRALWTEFSAHMDEHRGDMAGFARKKGWQSVAPEYRQGKAVLVVKTGAAPLKSPPATRPAPATKQPAKAGKPAAAKKRPPGRPR